MFFFLSPFRRTFRGPWALGVRALMGRPGDAPRIIAPENDARIIRALHEATAPPPKDFMAVMLNAFQILRRHAATAKDCLLGSSPADKDPPTTNGRRRAHQQEQILGDETARARNPSRCDFASPAKGRRAANAGVARLKGRLLGLSLDMTVIAGDGNCLFRSCSHQLFGSEAHHEFIRTSTVDYMRDHASDFKAFFAGSLFDRYLTRMRRDRTWGDELTLRGICNCFGCHIHVVTSLEHNWYLKYSPVRARTQKHVFLAYISPAHYNSIVLAPGALDASGQRQSGGAGTERTRKRAGDPQKRRVGELDGSNAGRRVSSRRSK